MADEKVVKYIKAEQKKGFSEDKIRQALVKAKYKTDVVDEAFKSAHANQKPVSAKGFKTLLLVVVCLLLLCAAGYLYLIIAPLSSGKSFGIVDATLCNSAATYPEYNSCWRALQPSTITSMSDCEKISDSLIVSLCKAVLSGKPGDCQKTADPNFCKYLQLRDRDYSLRCVTVTPKLMRDSCLAQKTPGENFAQYGSYFFIFS